VAENPAILAWDATAGRDQERRRDQSVTHRSVRGANTDVK